MKKLVRIVGVVLLLGILLLVFALVYTTVKGQTAWYFRVNGVITVNGQETTGYLHANSQRTILLITRTDGKKNETYLVPVTNRAVIMDCGDWNTVRFLPIPVGDLSPPCSAFTNPERVLDPSIPATLVQERRSISFSTASGKKIKAEW